MPAPFDAIHDALSQTMLTDRPALRRQLAKVERLARSGKPHDRALGRLQAQLEASRSRRAERAAHVPTPRYPEELPVSARRDDIAEAIRHHQVVVVAGETGSGKTTQLPKICLELGRGVDGLIGHTQPRRIAARSVAARVADELESELGDVVGYQVRFHDQVGARAHIKLMTDGVLLAETQSDPDLLRYDTLIIDEAHERSLNIDFLLGYLKQLLPRRPDLKLIITSATIDTERFAHHFDTAPVVEVSGRTYPVEVRYRPLQTVEPEQDDLDLATAVVEAVDELARLGPGDVLVFLPGERDIREVADALRKHHPPHTEILPLFARLSVADQNRVFQPHGSRRIVLSTNVAETSLTVPGIRYVVDSGLARISRYSHRSKVQRLPIEKVSQASCNQRAGRCGRVGPGVCVRLYDDEDYQARPAFTEPEIQRTNLAAVILRMLDLGLGDIEAFPFVDAPDRRFINDGYRTLQELSALDEQRTLTGLGRELARLPVDPRIGRMLLAGRDEGCLRELLVIASALSVQDPRERPADAQQKADEAHARYADPGSDFVALLNLWRFYHEQARKLSRNQLRKLCRTNFLAQRRMQEWHDLHQQLANQVKEMGLRLNQVDAEPDAIHRAVLSGLLSHIGLHLEDGDYLGTHGKRFRIFPGSGVRGRPKWIAAAELVETARLFARTVAVIKPQWIERAGAHLLKRSYDEPHWEKRQGRVMAFERASLYGIDVIARRKVHYGPIDPQLARELFIREGLVTGAVQTRAPFLAHNQRFVAEIEALEDKSRRRDILVDDQTLFEFYDRRVPEDIYSARRFEQWLREAEREQPRLLYFHRDQLMRHEADEVSAQRFPDELALDGLRLPLHYCFEPGREDDGVTVEVPLPALNQFPPARLEWLVPGLLEEKITALIKTLPKQLRRNFVPAPDFAAACGTALAFGEGALLPALSRELTRMTGVAVSLDSWQPERLADHLRMNVRVVDEQGRVLASGRDLQPLQAQLAGKAEASFSEWTAEGIECDDLDRWENDLPRELELQRSGLTLRVYPGLQAEDGRIAVRVFDSAEQAEAAMRGGLCALFLRRERKLAQYVRKNLPGLQQMCLIYASVDRCERLREDLLHTAACRALLGDVPPPFRVEDFEACSRTAAASLVELSNQLCGWVGESLATYQRIQAQLKGGTPPAWLAAVADIQDQLQHLIYPGFVAAAGHDRLRHHPRYLAAIERRLQRLAKNPARDAALQAQVAPLWRAWKELPKEASERPEWKTFRWRLEELRVSLFAQELGTAEKVSVKRLQDALPALRG